MTAATSYIRQTTGAEVSHSAAVRLMANESEARQAQYGRSRAPANCAGNCSQGRQACTCRPAPRQKHTRFEVTLSDFGILGLDHQEHEPTAGAIDAQLTPLLRTAARLWPKVWRAAAVAAVVAGALALAGCGGGDDHDDRFEPALAMPQGVALVGDKIPGATVAFTAAATAEDRRIAMVNHIGPQGTGTAATEKTRNDCETAKRQGQTCVVIRTGADGMGAEISKWLLTEELGLILCDLTAFPDIDDTLIRCAHDAASRRTTL